MASAQRLLIIDDDLNLVLALYRALSHTYKVDTAKTASSGLYKAQTLNPDLIILDLGLPDKSGKTIVEQLRRLGLAVPILVLSGDGTLDSRINLLDIGANDYLIKPFSLAELKARVRVLLRQPIFRYDAQLISGDLVLDPTSRRVIRAGQSISLRRKEYSLLECLLRNASVCVARSYLINYAWGVNVSVSPNALDVHINNLRAKIDRGLAPPLIRTIHGSGYLLDSPLPEKIA